MMTKTQNILKIPQVLRARGYRLYTKDGRRLIDLWLNSGTALLGHTPPNVLRELKNTASRGLYAPYPHFTEGRLIKALEKLLPDYKFRIYNSRSGAAAQRFEIWRPFSKLSCGQQSSVSSVVELIIPTPLSLCVIAAQSEDLLANLPPSDTLPPLTLAVAARGIHDLLAAPERAHPQLPRTFKALKADTCPWHREAIYLKLKQETVSEKEWSALFDKFLEAGFLLPPTPEDPLILPGELSDGEDANLAKIIDASY